MLTQIDFEAATSRWKNEPILKLADHFHQLNNVGLQHERVRQFDMSQADIALFFQKIQAKIIAKINIHLALYEAPSNPTDNLFRFFLILEVIDTSENKVYLDLIPNLTVNRGPVGHNFSEIVPAIFKDTIAKNWDQFDFNQLDDLFTASAPIPNTAGTTLLRVEFFQIGKKIIDFINGELINICDNLEAVTLYPGIDLNKLNPNDIISFTPVLGLKTDHNIEEEAAQMGFVQCYARELYIEYTAPCPPTCLPNG